MSDIMLAYAGMVAGVAFIALGRYIRGAFPFGSGAQ